MGEAIQCKEAVLNFVRERTDLLADHIPAVPGLTDARIKTIGKGRDRDYELVLTFDYVDFRTLNNAMRVLKMDGVSMLGYMKSEFATGIEVYGDIPREIVKELTA